MGFFSRIFAKPVTARELKTHLLQVERKRKKKQMELRKYNAKQTSLIERIKKARGAGNNLEVDYQWEDLLQIRVDIGFAKREARVLNLEAIGLKKYIYGIERLEKEDETEKIRKLFDRIKRSTLDAKLAVKEVNDQEYIEELKAILDDIGFDIDMADEMDIDPEKVRFLEEIDAINAAEEAGDFEEAVKKETELKAHLEDEETN